MLSVTVPWRKTTTEWQRLSGISSGSPSSDDGITAILAAVAAGDRAALGMLWTLIQDEVRAMAASLVARERSDATLQPTVLMHEVWLRLHGGEMVGSFENRRHYFGAIAVTMRRVLVDHARARDSAKRNHGRRPEPLDLVGDQPMSPERQDPEDLHLVVQALDALAARHPRAAEVARLRTLVGLPAEQVAAILDIAPRTVRADWTFAKAWMRAWLAR